VRCSSSAIRFVSVRMRSAMSSMAALFARSAPASTWRSTTGTRTSMDGECGSAAGGHVTAIGS
jgi:hypothetical protein